VTAPTSTPALALPSDSGRYHVIAQYAFDSPACEHERMPVTFANDGYRAP
jgi:hypothetical protein